MKFADCPPLKTCCLLAAMLCGCGWAQAEIYKSVDAEGHVTYSSTPSKGAKRLGFESLTPTAPPPSSSPRHARTRNSNSASPADFPRVDSSTQKSRDSTRRQILGDELATEEKLLAEARTSLQQGEAARNATKIQTLREEVILHERNIAALKTELSNVK